MATPLLQVQNCSIRFGGLTAVNDVSFDVNSGEIMAVIGPNGAGKTTLFNLLTGVYEMTSGDIVLSGSSIKGLSVVDINCRGVARTFQNIRLFSNLTVIDNVKVAFYQALSSGLIAASWNSKGNKAEEKNLKERASTLLALFHLEGKSDELAKNLSYGEQRRLEMARALATQPKLLLLDEPAAGMNASEKHELADWIRKIHKDFNLTIILIEHDMKFVMDLVPRILVLDYGSRIAEGTPDEIRRNEKVIEAYLGAG